MAMKEEYLDPALNGKGEEKKKSKLFANKYAIFCTLLATVCSTLLGYDIGVMSGAILFIKDDLKLGLVQQEVAVGSLNLISSLGALSAGRIADSIGRRRTMTSASAIFLVGAVIMASAPNFAALMVGRVVSGIGVGFAMMIAPLYSAELAPANIRGSLVSLSEIFINVGILLGYIVSFALQGVNPQYNWRIMLAIAAAPAIILAIGVLFMPESPRWLVMQGRMEEARGVLVRTSGGDKSEAETRLQEIFEAASEEGYDVSSADTPKRKQGEGVWKELLRPTPAVRRMLIVALGINFFQQASGIDATVYYSPVVFSQAGVTSKLGKLGATMGVGFAKLLFIFVATFFLDRVGRKPLLLVSGIGLTACLVTVGIAFLALGMNSAKGDTLLSAGQHVGKASGVNAGAVITIAAVCGYVAFFSIGFGPIVWVLTSEIFPLRLRSQAMGLSVTVNRLISGTVALTFLSIAKGITPAGTFFLFAAIGATSVVFICFMVPETKGKTLEELEKFFKGEKEHPTTNPNQGGKGVEITHSSSQHAHNPAKMATP